MNNSLNHKGLKGKVLNQKNLMVYFGHHKCASMYIYNIIKSLGYILDYKVKEEYLADKLPFNYHLIDLWKERIDKITVPDRESGIDFWCYLNASRNIADRMTGINYKGFHVIRDPRDILVSGYFSHKYSHPISEDYNPWKIKHRERLLSVEMEAGLFAELDFCSVYFERLATWDYHNKDILETRFETLVHDPYQEFYKILDFLGMKFNRNEAVVFVTIIIRKLFRKIYDFSGKQYTCSPWVLKTVLARHSFEKKAKREKGIENQHSHYRKGIIGDWKNYFTPGLKKEFKKRYGQLLVKLSYEKDDTW
jgi:hypothetical protein